MQFFKKFIFAALTAVILTTVCGAVELKPGINLLTGTKEPQTFEVDLTELPNGVSVDNAVRVDTPITGETGKVLYNNNKTSVYASIKFNFDTALPKERPYRISFKIYQKAETGYGETPKNLWIMKNGVSGWQIARTFSNGMYATNKEWLEYSTLVSKFDKLTNTETGVLDTSNISAILLEWAYDSKDAATSGKQKVYLDDMSIIPAYKVTYLDEAGTEIRTDYEEIVGNTFTPALRTSDSANGIIGWSVENDRTVDEVINVNHEDITLYAVYDYKVHISLSSDVTMLDEKGAQTVIKAAVSNVRNENTTFAWAISEGAEYVTLTENADNSVTITSVAEGLSKITYTASSGEAGEMYILSEYISLEAVEVKEKAIDLGKVSALYNHNNSYYDENEGAYKFVKSDNIINPGTGSAYTDGFIRLETGDIDTTVYKYLLLTYKQNGKKNYQLRAIYDNGWHAVTINGVHPISLDSTDGEYVTYAIDINAGTNGATISNLVLGILTVDEAYFKDIRFSNIPSLELETPSERRLEVITEPTNITTDRGSVPIKAAVFKNKKVSTASSPVWTVSDASKAYVKVIDDYNAELVALENGEVTVTVSDSNDASVSRSFNVTISGQRAKQSVYNIRVLFWGASITKHGPSEALGWTGNWGMAASSEDKDYVHQMVTMLEEEFYPSKVEFYVIANNSSFDAEVSGDTDPKKDYASNGVVTALEAAIRDFKPNIVCSWVGANLRATAQEDCVFNAWSQVYDMVYNVAPGAILLSGHCALGHDAMVESVHENLIERYKNTGNIFVQYHTTVSEDPDKYFAYYLENVADGVKRHWGDEGMRKVARDFTDLATPYIRSELDAKYIYLPERIEISGDTSITTEGGSIKLTATAYPSDADASVIWSVDDERIATIDENGKLTAINNGTVTLTATSVYNASLVEKFTVTITGQPAAYTLTYNANTESSVNGLPAVQEYVRGETALSEKRPLRDNYVFVGWSKSPTSNECVTSVDVTGDTTVYAVWEKINGFEFDGTYDEFFGYTYGFSIEGGFHAEVIDGKLAAICSAGQKVKFKSPVVDIADMDKITFALESGYTDETAQIVLTVRTNASEEKTYIYDINNTSMNVYEADISALTGAVTDFDIYVDAVPADSSMFSIYVDYVRFSLNKVDVTGVSLDKTSAALIVGSTETLTATVSPSNATNKNVSWTSSDEKVAAVDQNGVVSAISAGTATITVTTEDQRKTANCVVSVKEKPVVSVESAETNAGKTVDVTLKIENNPGIEVMRFNIGYDSSAMTLQKATAGEVFGSENVTEGDLTKAPYTFFAINKELKDISTDGNLVTLTFLVKDTCAVGDYAITVTDMEAYNINDSELEFDVETGVVKVTKSEVMFGDVTGDGKVDTNDLLRLAKYLADWDVEIDEDAADVAANGKVDTNDLLRLAKYLADWDVELGK